MSDPNRPTPSATITYWKNAGTVARWEDRKTYDKHVSEVAEACRTKCALGSGGCCMKLTLDSFVAGEKEIRAIVSSKCEAENCPDPDAVIDAVCDVARGADSFGHVSRYGHTS